MLKLVTNREHCRLRPQNCRVYLINTTDKSFRCLTAGKEYDQGTYWDESDVNDWREIEIDRVPFRCLNNLTNLEYIQLMGRRNVKVNDKKLSST